MFSIPDWFILTFGSLAVIISLLSGWLYVAGDGDEKQTGVTVFVGWWGGVAAVTAATLFMTFVVKPMIQFVLDLF